MQSSWQSIRQKQYLYQRSAERALQARLRLQATEVTNILAEGNLQFNRHLLEDTHSMREWIVEKRYLILIMSVMLALFPIVATSFFRLVPLTTNEFTAVQVLCYLFGVAFGFEFPYGLILLPIIYLLMRQNTQGNALALSYWWHVITVAPLAAYAMWLCSFLGGIGIGLFTISKHRAQQLQDNQ